MTWRGIPPGAQVKRSLLRSRCETRRGGSGGCLGEPSDITGHQARGGGAPERASGARAAANLEECCCHTWPVTYEVLEDGLAGIWAFILLRILASSSSAISCRLLTADSFALCLRFAWQLRWNAPQALATRTGSSTQTLTANTCCKSIATVSTVCCYRSLEGLGFALSTLKTKRTE